MQQCTQCLAWIHTVSTCACGVAVASVSVYTSMDTCGHGCVLMSAHVVQCVHGVVVSRCVSTLDGRYPGPCICTYMYTWCDV